MIRQRSSFTPSALPLRTAPKIAIVDIDIHHGNGTEEIVRNLTPRKVFLPLPSSWAPVSKLVYKPWLNEQDSKEVLFSSIHLFGGETETESEKALFKLFNSLFFFFVGEIFYPGSGAESPEDINNNNNIINITLSPVGPGPWDPVARGKLTQTKREGYCKQASEEFR
jgi:acetoin utilization deacetylase AcuC-like enzyme